MKVFLTTVTILLGLNSFSEPLNVWCSIPPLMSIVREIAGDRASVSCFMNGSQDPHTFSPTPRTVSKAKDADLFLAVGMPFETVVQKKLSGLNRNLNTVNLATNIDIYPAGEIVFNCLI